MKKKAALILVFIILTVCGFYPAAEEGWNIAYNGEGITLSGSLGTSPGVPFMLIIAKPGVLAEDLLSSAPEDIAALTEYINTLTTDENGGLLNFYIGLKEELGTGLCRVYISHIESDGYKEVGSFYNVSRAVVAEILEYANEKEPEEYESIFTPESIMALKALGANVDTYEKISDASTFYNMLSEFVPFEEDAERGQNAISVFVEKFNYCCVFMELNESDDILSTINKYNGEYWQIATDDNKGFGKLPATLRSDLLTELKKNFYKRADELEAAFLEKLALYVFKSCQTRDELKEAVRDYNDYYKLDLALLENSKLNTFNLTEIYNNILDSNKACQSFVEIKKLYTDSINKVLDSLDKKPKTGGNSPVGSVSGGRDISYIPPKTDIDNSTPKQEESDSFFEDVPRGHWAYEYIKGLYEKGIVSGKSEKEFKPSDKILREEFVKIIVGALGLELTTQSAEFIDVKPGSWYEPYVDTAVKEGLVTGMCCLKFGVGSELSRQDAAVILDRALSMSGIISEEKGAAFADVENISDYALESVSRTAAVGLFKGDGENRFMPQKGISRAEVCAVVYRLISLTGEGK